MIQKNCKKNSFLEYIYSLYESLWLFYNISPQMYATHYYTVIYIYRRHYCTVLCSPLETLNTAETAYTRGHIQSDNGPLHVIMTSPNVWWGPIPHMNIPKNTVVRRHLGDILVVSAFRFHFSTALCVLESARLLMINKVFWCFMIIFMVKYNIYGDV